MPAPKSILTEKPKPYAPVTNAIAIYEKTLHICLKMPKRYTYLILQDVIRLAGEVMDNTKKANSVFAQNLHEAQIRKDYWINARASLQALSSRIDRFIDAPQSLRYRDEHSNHTKGVTMNELKELAELMIKEQSLIKSAIDADKKKSATLSN